MPSPSRMYKSDKIEHTRRKSNPPPTKEEKPKTKLSTSAIKDLAPAAPAKGETTTAWKASVVERARVGSVVERARVGSVDHEARRRVQDKADLMRRHSSDDKPNKRSRHDEKPYRTGRSYVPRTDSELGTERFSYRAARSDRPYGWGDEDDDGPDGYGRFDRFEAKSK